MRVPAGAVLTASLGAKAVETAKDIFGWVMKGVRTALIKGVHSRYGYVACPPTRQMRRVSGPSPFAAVLRTKERISRHCPRNAAFRRQPSAAYAMLPRK